MLTQREKSPLPEAQRRVKPMTLHHTWLRAQHTTSWAIPAPIVVPLIYSTTYKDRYSFLPKHTQSTHHTHNHTPSCQVIIVVPFSLQVIRVPGHGHATALIGVTIWGVAVVGWWRRQVAAPVVWISIGVCVGVPVWHGSSVSPPPSSSTPAPSSSTVLIHSGHEKAGLPESSTCLEVKKIKHVLQSTEC